MRPPALQPPPYRVPLMSEVRAEPIAPFVAASTFSGAGGSSLGYRMAGIKVGWASEFVEAAADVYRANFPDTILDTRDIREVTGDEILAALKIERGELDLLDGSPPCASFSVAGRREITWGQVRAYSETRQRVDDLFDEFVRLVDETRPRVFVAENVAGLVIGTAKGYFKTIFRAMRAIGYRVEARLLDAQWLGVPQTRRRLIFVGVRDDLDLDPVYPAPLPYRYTLRDALPHLIAHQRGSFNSEWGSSDTPAGTVTASDAHRGHRHQVIVDGDLAEYAIGTEYDRLRPGEQSGRYFNLIRASPDRPSPCITAGSAQACAAGATHPYERRKFAINELRRICGFPDDFILLGTYEQQYERLARAVPPPMMAAVARAIRTGILEVSYEH